MDAIRWPTGPFRFRRRKIGVVMGAIAWINLLFGAGVLAFLSQLEPFQQIGANLLASIGFGDTITEIRVDRIDCSHWSGHRGGVYHCDATLIGPTGISKELAVSSSFDLEEREPPRVTRILGRTALGYPLWLMLVDLFPIFLAVAFCGGMVFLGWFMLGGGDFLLRRRYHHARIIEVDLLRRKMRNELLADWDLAFEDGGRRRIQRYAVAECPVLLDGIVTRGAALVPRRGKARLLTLSYWPLDLDEPTLAALQVDVGASYHAPRSALPDRFIECVAAAEGAEREFVEGWRAAWSGPDVEAINAGIGQRHDAALKLSAKRLDALLRRCRECARA
jgi:hypothetical protein